MKFWKWRKITMVMTPVLGVWTLLVAFWAADVAESWGEGLGALAVFLAAIVWSVGLGLILAVLFLVARRG
jgi:hypothetical protein